MSDVRIFEIYRYDPDKDEAPYMQTYLKIDQTSQTILTA